MARPGDIGRFIEKWARLEVVLQERQPDPSHYRASVGSVIQSVIKGVVIDRSLATTIENLRSFRNRLVHRTTNVSQQETSEALDKLLYIMDKLDQ